ncbi:male-enhanced antigen 1 [Thalassophryne amazonica]|uniref:male-enhanced antigen 1 n=1 Tax=Thalassophryne amazonica TaxID=390379 RepID=UPI001470F207|nr:male-enhanced antigen 1 [Thalassophryne amazonica]XP_034040210.1 male-enhanced antigen 1 [Thalassophryne amazonica]
MDVRSAVMGPERVFPSCEDELGEDECLAEGVLLPAAAVWAEGEGGGDAEEEAEESEQGGDVEEEEENMTGEYYYQPLSQEPDGPNTAEPRENEEEQQEGVGPEEEEEEASHSEQLQQVQRRIEVMGLHLPEAPPPDSDEEDDPDGAQQSHASIPMDAEHVELVKRTMAGVALPSLGVPAWAQELSDDQWRDMMENTLQSFAALRLHRSNK